MADIDKLETAPKEQLWKHLKDVRCVMLGSPDPNQHMQPMTPQIEEEAQEIWFFASKSSELVQTLGVGAHTVHMCVVEKDYQACLQGALRVEMNTSVLERHWNSVVAAWFEGGKSDPDLIMLCFRPQNASIWASSQNPITFAYEIAKANMKEQTPDIGSRANVNF